MVYLYWTRCSTSLIFKIHIIKEDYSGCCGHFEILLCNLFSGDWTPAHLWVDFLLGLRQRNPIVLARVAGSGTWHSKQKRRAEGKRKPRSTMWLNQPQSPCTPPPGLLGVSTSLLTGKTVWWAFCNLQSCPTDMSHHFSFIIVRMDQHILLYSLLARVQEKEHSCSLFWGFDWCKSFRGQVAFKTQLPYSWSSIPICILQTQLPIYKIIHRSRLSNNSKSTWRVHQ